VPLASQHERENERLLLKAQAGIAVDEADLAAARRAGSFLEVGYIDGSAV